MRGVAQVLQNDIDLLNPPAELEKLKHKKKRLVQSPNSFFMDVKCQGCFNITTVFSHSQTVVVCPGCQTVLCQPTGGKARLTEGCSFRRKGSGGGPVVIAEVEMNVGVDSGTSAPPRSEPPSCRPPPCSMTPPPLSGDIAD
ncbi:hypothetical protein ABZP36_033184 [Zizania latifolia]